MAVTDSAQASTVVAVDAVLWFTLAVSALQLLFAEWVQSGCRAYLGGEVNFEDAKGGKRGGAVPGEVVARWGRIARNSLVALVIQALAAMTFAAGIKLNYSESDFQAFVILSGLFVLFRSAYMVCYAFAFQPYRSIFYTAATLTSVISAVWGIILLLVQLTDASDAALASAESDNIDLAIFVVVIVAVIVALAVAVIAALAYVRDPEDYAIANSPRPSSYSDDYYGLYSSSF